VFNGTEIYIYPGFMPNARVIHVICQIQIYPGLMPNAILNANSTVDCGVSSLKQTYVSVRLLCRLQKKQRSHFKINIFY
jgi:hypothetical protein